MTAAQREEQQMQAMLAASRQEKDAMIAGDSGPQTKEEILAEVGARFPTVKDMLEFHYTEVGGDKKKLIRTLKS